MVSLRMLRDVWAFRAFIAGSVKREFQSRYLGTQFGPFWVVAQPLAMIIVYTVVFAQIMKPSLPGHESSFAYGIFLCSGVLTWGVFAEMLGRCVNIFVESGSLLKKIQFPKLCLPIIVVASSWVHFSIVLAIFLTFLLVTGNFPGWVLVAVAPVIVLQAAFTVGLGVLLATVNVFYRDVGQAVSVALQFWFWLTPIVYVPTILPQFAVSILAWNPVWPIVDAYHRIFLDHQWPQWGALLYPACLALILTWLGLSVFRKLQGEIVDEL